MSGARDVSSLLGTSSGLMPRHTIIKCPLIGFHWGDVAPSEVRAKLSCLFVTPFYTLPVRVRLFTSYSCFHILCFRVTVFLFPYIFLFPLPNYHSFPLTCLCSNLFTLSHVFNCLYLSLFLAYTLGFCPYLGLFLYLGFNKLRLGFGAGIGD